MSDIVEMVLWDTLFRFLLAKTDGLRQLLDNKVRISNLENVPVHQCHRFRLKVSSLGYGWYAIIFHELQAINAGWTCQVQPSQLLLVNVVD